MAEKDNGSEDDVNLELPSLGLGGLRRRKKEPRAEAPPAETPAEPPMPAEPPAHAPEPTRPLFADEEPEAVDEPEAVAEPATPAPEPTAQREREPFRLPAVPGMAAACITGLLIGLLAVGLTYLALEGCTAVKGTSSCGSPGFLLLVGILVLLIVVGGAILRAWDVTDPASTSFLAVGLLAVVALLFLVDVIFEWWMVIAIPLVAIVTFALSHWVTTRFIEPAEQ